VRQLELRSQLRERLEIDAGEAWLQFMAAVSKHYEELRRGVQMVAQFDCLLSLAKLATQEHYILPAVGRCR
jgi:DNA mismatch repair ATPase MutS